MTMISTHLLSLRDKLKELNPFSTNVLSLRDILGERNYFLPVFCPYGTYKMREVFCTDMLSLWSKLRESNPFF